MRLYVRYKISIIQLGEIIVADGIKNLCALYIPSWHYSEEEDRQQCEERMEWVEMFFERKRKEPADDAAADIGYCCG